MADDSLFGGFDFGDLLNAALTYYGIHQADRPPRFYNAPPTPEEKWRTDAAHNLYNTASGFTNQYLSGLGNLNPDFKLNTNLVGNPAFMGGIHVPTIDMSKVPPISGNSTPAPTTPNTTPPGPVPTVNPFGPDQPGGHPDPFADFPSGPDTSSVDPGSVMDWINAHPDVVKGGMQAITAGLGAAFGLPGVVAGRIATWALNLYTKNHPPDPNAPQQLPPGNRNYTPGDVAPGGQAPPMTKVHIDPSTGHWSMDNPSPGEQAWLDAINAQNDRLMTGPGDPGYGHFGGGFGGDMSGGYFGSGPYGVPRF